MENLQKYLSTAPVLLTIWLLLQLDLLLKLIVSSLIC
jgi:hypothetical protein